MKPRWTLRAILPFIYHCIITHGARAWGPGLVASRADKIFFSALFTDSVVRKTIFSVIQRTLCLPHPYCVLTSPLSPTHLPFNVTSHLSGKKFPSVKKFVRALVSIKF